MDTTAEFYTTAELSLQTLQQNSISQRSCPYRHYSRILYYSTVVPMDTTAEFYTMLYRACIWFIVFIFRFLAVVVTVSFIVFRQLNKTLANQTNPPLPPKSIENLMWLGLEKLDETGDTIDHYIRVCTHWVPVISTPLLSLLSPFLLYLLAVRLHGWLKLCTHTSPCMHDWLIDW